MRVRKGLAAGLLLITPALGPATATPAFAAETALVVQGEPSPPGGLSQATCPSGTHLTGGGYQLPPGAHDTVTYNGPSVDAKSWYARADHTAVKAFAVCETED
ncbi:hypothetical protein ATKI12_2890 [Kitasatospora sp. Ki12]|uniref:hypothetical protein n=1 Tax=Kitasatospora xanthocidica TaxID=83382 RepID=UPI0016766203|nr:hypothetical protein [Kitasatospora xanthocidica]